MEVTDKFHLSIQDLFECFYSAETHEFNITLMFILKYIKSEMRYGHL